MARQNVIHGSHPAVNVRNPEGWGGVGGQTPGTFYVAGMPDGLMRHEHTQNRLWWAPAGRGIGFVPAPLWLSELVDKHKTTGLNSAILNKYIAMLDKEPTEKTVAAIIGDSFKPYDGFQLKPEQIYAIGRAAEFTNAIKTLAFYALSNPKLMPAPEHLAQWAKLHPQFAKVYEAQVGILKDQAGERAALRLKIDAVRLELEWARATRRAYPEIKQTIIAGARWQQDDIEVKIFGPLVDRLVKLERELASQPESPWMVQARRLEPAFFKKLEIGHKKKISEIEKTLTTKWTKTTPFGVTEIAAAASRRASQWQSQSGASLEQAIRRSYPKEFPCPGADLSRHLGRVDVVQSGFAPRLR
jgi:hypothetical protein